MSNEVPPDWLEQFALHIRNQTLDMLVQAFRKGKDPSSHSLADALEQLKTAPADQWWKRGE